MEYQGIPKEALEFLRKPFEDHELGWLPKVVTKSKFGEGFTALALPYVDREAGTKRLHDSGLCWEFDFEDDPKSTDDHAIVTGILKIHLASGKTLTYKDRGEAHRRSKDNDDDPDAWESPKEIHKEAVTDAFKRVVRFVGIGSYLTGKEQVWKPCEVKNPQASKPRFKKWADGPEKGPSGSGGSQTTSRTSQAEKTATSAQLERIRRDMAKFHVAEATVFEKLGVKGWDEISFKQASFGIDHIKDWGAPASV